MKNKIFNCLFALFLIFSIAGCTNSNVTSDLSGNIPLTEYDTKNKLARIATDVISTETNFSQNMVTMIQPTSNVTETDFVNLSNGITKAIKTINDRKIEIESFTCPESMKNSRDNLKNNLEDYLTILNNIKNASDEKDITTIKNQYSNFKNIISSLQSVSTSL